MLEEKIYNDYVSALKARDRIKIDFLSLLRADLKNLSINLKKDKLDDNEVLSVFKKQQKRLQDAKESIVKSGRSDLIESLEKELAILTQYLPQPLSDKEVSQVVNKVISELGASSMKDIGKVMKEVLAQIGPRTDSKKVSLLVKESLAD